MWHSSAITDSSSFSVASIISSFLQMAQRFPERPQRIFLVLLLIAISLSYAQHREFYAASRATKTFKAHVPRNCLTKLQTTDLTNGMMNKTWLDWAALCSLKSTTTIYRNCKAAGRLQIFAYLRGVGLRFANPTYR